MQSVKLNANRPLVLMVWLVSVGAVVWLSLLPGTGEPPAFAFADKLKHCAAYAWLALLPMRGFGERRWAIGAAGAMVFLGAGLEIGQAFVALREPSLGDLAANMLGVVIGIRLGIRLKARDALRQSGLARWYNEDGSRKDTPGS